MGRLVFLVLFALIPFNWANSDQSSDQKLQPAIEFMADMDWLNVSRPLTIEELRGKVVILDFWTYGCINCIHVLEDLDRLQQKYADQIAIIGIHTPKFDNEKNLETLRRVVIRYGITHPVINDVHSMLAREYGMRAWPTQFVITPQGKVLGKVVGEGNYDVFLQVIDKLLDTQSTANKLPLPIKLEIDKLQASLLAFPGKIAVSAQQVAISDTLHHRIIITDHNGKLERIIGGSTPGFVNGNSLNARFVRPQGLAFLDETLYVADTGNHSIRVIDLNSGKVTTVAGTGKIAHRIRENTSATETSLRSPWDLAVWKNKLIIAMAGDHQIWLFDPVKDRIIPFSGNGREALVDGSLEQASYSQPSGLSLYQNKLYVADSESSAVRKIDLNSDRVSTLLGKGLFDFGDQDGELSDALLQHTLGIAALSKNQIYIADTYNHKLKIIDIDEQHIQTVVGTGVPGMGTGPGQTAMLNEPGGLAVLNNKILIADTNNHRIMQYDPTSGELSSWQISFE